MKPFLATMLGGTYDGRQIAVGVDVQHIDIPNPSSDAAAPVVERYRRKIWARVLDDSTREIAMDTFYVLDSMSDQEATTALLQRLRAQATE